MKRIKPRSTEPIQQYKHPLTLRTTLRLAVIAVGTVTFMVVLMYLGITSDIALILLTMPFSMASCMFAMMLLPMTEKEIAEEEKHPTFRGKPKFG